MCACVVLPFLLRLTTVNQTPSVSASPLHPCQKRHRIADFARTPFTVQGKSRGCCYATNARMSTLLAEDYFKDMLRNDDNNEGREESTRVNSYLY